jgi:hypothetical protein
VLWTAVGVFILVSFYLIDKNYEAFSFRFSQFSPSFYF